MAAQWLWGGGRTEFIGKQLRGILEPAGWSVKAGGLFSLTQKGWTWLTNLCGFNLVWLSFYHGVLFVGSLAFERVISLGVLG